MRSHVDRTRLADACRTLRLPFDGALAGRRVSIGCPICWPLDREQLVILTLDETGQWLGRCRWLRPLRLRACGRPPAGVAGEAGGGAGVTTKGAAAVQEPLGLFCRWLHLPDPDVVLVVLAVVVANRMPGDPVWLLVVGPSGGGKTEILQAISGLPDVTVAGVLTEASLLSGTPKKDKAGGARGGLLRDIGPFGIVTLKDFGSVLSMKAEARAALLAALREVYDGEWTRHVGTDGGRTLHWSGKVGLVAGCTPVIDTHHGVMAALGERFAMYRLAVEDDDAQARASLDHHGHEDEMRGELRAAVGDLLDGLAGRARPRSPPTTGTGSSRSPGLWSGAGRLSSVTASAGRSTWCQVGTPGRLVGVLPDLDRVSGARR